MLYCGGDSRLRHKPTNAPCPQPRGNFPCPNLFVGTQKPSADGNFDETAVGDELAEILATPGSSVTVCAALAGTHRVHWVAGWLHPGAEEGGVPTLL